MVRGGAGHDVHDIFAGATDDIAVDGIYLTALDKTTQAKYIGWQGAFYNLAKVLVNGGLVYLAGVLMKHFANGYGNAPLIAWRIIVGIMASIMIIVAVYHIFSFHEAPSTRRHRQISG